MGPVSASGYGHSHSHSVIYKYDVPAGFDEHAVEALLQRARANGVVTEYDAGRGTVCWFEGPPGVAMRALRELVVEMLGPSAKPWS